MGDLIVRFFARSAGSKNSGVKIVIYVNISYQFEVNGQVYYGEGEGSGAFWERDKQTICYDPNDPDDNCTLYYLNSKTKSHFLKTLLFFIGMLVFLYIAIVVFAKLRK